MPDKVVPDADNNHFRAEHHQSFTVANTIGGLEESKSQA
jgi:hypothetical protein